eukprot:CAMPEP_0113911662 /NCGR_PEP_ID=MMETSP0780_2-20120614/28375_1 /TAXON_ID=652834 /ORGANISM="Palpitomonas bilix" /LENGTH=347 /DNA_ID=CAMNT_0000908293 /DNA_START=121 /DNA_END=1164 /DNA_ORIENTATION=- /assembly_acc=CAM_ASM_000599
MSARVEVERKLKELLGEGYDEAILEYVLVVLDNPEKSAEELIADFSEFFGENEANAFVRWCGIGQGQQTTKSEDAKESVNLAEMMEEDGGGDGRVIFDLRGDKEESEEGGERSAEGRRGSGGGGRIASSALKSVLQPSSRNEAEERRAKKQAAKLRMAEQKARQGLQPRSRSNVSDAEGSSGDLRVLLHRRGGREVHRNESRSMGGVQKQRRASRGGSAGSRGNRGESDLRATLNRAKEMHRGPHKGAPLLAAPPGFALVPVAALSAVAGMGINGARGGGQFSMRGGRGGFSRGGYTRDGMGFAAPARGRGGGFRGRGRGRGAPEIQPVPKSARQWVNPNLMKTEGQ